MHKKARKEAKTMHKFTRVMYKFIPTFAFLILYKPAGYITIYETSGSTNQCSAYDQYGSKDIQPLLNNVQAVRWKDPEFLTHTKRSVLTSIKD